MQPASAAAALAADGQETLGCQMTDADSENAPFYAKVEQAFRDLVDRARQKHELHFAMALMPEMRGMQDAGWGRAGSPSAVSRRTPAVIVPVHRRLRRMLPGAEASQLRGLLARTRRPPAIVGGTYANHASCTSRLNACLGTMSSWTSTAA